MHHIAISKSTWRWSFIYCSSHTPQRHSPVSSRCYEAFLFLSQLSISLGSLPQKSNCIIVNSPTLRSSLCCHCILSFLQLPSPFPLFLQLTNLILLLLSSLLIFFLIFLMDKGKPLPHRPLRNFKLEFQVTNQSAIIDQAFPLSKLPLVPERLQH